MGNAHPIFTRLINYYRRVIKTKTLKTFDDTAQVFLFGSRIFNTQKGGDIDLYIVTDNKDNLFEKELLF